MAINKLGYRIYKRKITNLSKINFLKSFKKVLKVCLNLNDFSLIKNIDTWEDQTLHDVLINLRKKNKDKFSLIYDLMQKNICLDFFCSQNKLANYAANFLNIKKDEMMMTSQFRMDTPTDKRNIYDWHQDSAYDKLNHIPKNGVVLWMPLINTNKKNGTILVKPKSQKENNVYVLKKKLKKFISPQLTVPNSYLKKYKSKDIPVKTGDCLAIYPNLFHKSGDNRSNKIRFTILSRFNKILTTDFSIYKNRI